jgi:hypothetical protein
MFIYIEWSVHCLFKSYYKTSTGANKFYFIDTMKENII